jgi:hypothetical protein
MHYVDRRSHRRRPYKCGELSTACSSKGGGGWRGWEERERRLSFYIKSRASNLIPLLQAGKKAALPLTCTAHPPLAGPDVCHLHLAYLAAYAMQAGRLPRAPANAKDRGLAFWHGRCRLHAPMTMRPPRVRAHMACIPGRCALFPPQNGPGSGGAPACPTVFSREGVSGLDRGPAALLEGVHSRRSDWVEDFFTTVFLPHLLRHTCFSHLGLVS